MSGAVVFHTEPPSWYFPTAWELLLCDTDEELETLLTEALEALRLEPRDLIRAICLASVPIVQGLRQVIGDETFEEVVIDYQEAIHYLLTTQEIQP